MRPDRSDLKYVWDMYDASLTALGTTSGRTLAEYERDKAMRYVVERAVEIIGEAARHVSEEFRALHPEIPWKPIVATRHIVAHEYGELEHDKMWRVATTHMPSLVSILKRILDANPPDQTN